LLDDSLLCGDAAAQRDDCRILAVDLSLELRDLSLKLRDLR
jgi:hypothetical protein